MERIHLLRRQHLVDNCAGMYMRLAVKINREFGRLGEESLRVAIRIMGRSMGHFFAQYDQKAINDRDLLDLDRIFRATYTDDRFFIQDEEKASDHWVFNILRCPFKNNWDQTGDENINYIFCEEFYPDFYKGLLGDHTQVNLSKMLTHKGDLHCEFAIYCREANRGSGHVETTCYETIVDPTAPFANDEREFYQRAWLIAWLSIYGKLRKDFGEKAILIMGEALREEANWAYNYLKLRAQMTGQHFDREFFDINHPMGTRLRREELHGISMEDDASKVLERNFFNQVNTAFHENERG